MAEWQIEQAGWNVLVVNNGMGPKNVLPPYGARDASNATIVDGSMVAIPDEVRPGVWHVASLNDYSPSWQERSGL